MRSSSFLLTFVALVPYIVQAQGASLVQSVSPILSDSTCAINCEDPGYRLMTQVIDGETITREYIIHVPSGYQEGDNLPLVIVYHGFGGCAYYMAEETGGLNDLANEENFFVAYPQAAYRPEKEDTYWEPGFNGGESIYLDDIFFSEQLIEHIDEEFSLDLSRVYAAGYSNGGMLTYSLACLRGDLFAGVCVMSGALLDGMDSCDPAQPVPMIIFHGTGDFVLPYNGDQYYASVPDVVSLWTDHFQIPTSTLTSTDLNGGNVVHDSYHGGTNNTCLSCTRCLRSMDSQATMCGSVRTWMGSPQIRSCGNFLPTSVVASMAFSKKVNKRFRRTQSLSRTSSFSEMLVSVQPRFTCRMSRVFWFGQDVWGQTDQSMDSVICLQGAIC